MNPPFLKPGSRTSQSIPMLLLGSLGVSACENTQIHSNVDDIQESTKKVSSANGGTQRLRFLGERTFC